MQSFKIYETSIFNHDCEQWEFSDVFDMCEDQNSQDSKGI